jgi:hypothetical protein
MGKLSYMFDVGAFKNQQVTCENLIKLRKKIDNKEKVC